MIKSEQIRKALSITRVSYDNCRETFFAKWCNLYARRLAVPLRQMMLSEQLHSWYCDQWSRKVEMPFCVDYQEYLESGIEAPETYQDLFLEYAESIEEFYPKILMEPIIQRHKTQHHLQA